MASARVVREVLLDAVRRHGRVGHEVEDLAHDLIVSALGRAVPLDGLGMGTFAHGAARRHAAFVARTAARRRAREARYAGEVDGGADAGAGVDEAAGSSLAALTPTLRTTLYLLWLGLDKAELRVVLGISDAALRKRFEALRAHAPLERPALPRRARTATEVSLRRAQVALLPRLAPVAVGGATARRVIALGDPDGHGVIVRAALTPGAVTATTGGQPTRARAVGPT